MAKVIIGNVEGPQGIRGLQGPKGDTGPIGPPGEVPQSLLDDVIDLKSNKFDKTGGTLTGDINIQTTTPTVTFTDSRGLPPVKIGYTKSGDNTFEIGSGVKTLQFGPDGVLRFNKDEVLTANSDVFKGKQDKTDNSLNTADKTVAGAINELNNNKVNNPNRLDFFDNEINGKDGAERIAINYRGGANSVDILDGTGRAVYGPLNAGDITSNGVRVWNENTLKCNVNGRNELIMEVMSLKVTKTVTQIKFRNSFPNDCLSVIPIDVASANAYKLAVDNVTKNGFQLLAESASASWVQYVAIGY